MGSRPDMFASEPIAIVGSSCRLPGGANSSSRLWELLETPRDVVQQIPASRFNTEAFYHVDSQHHGSTNVKHAYLLDEDPRGFDRDFFSINPKEAEAMDPQQRQLLETVYEGIESAGYSMQQLRGSSTAVFVGCMFYDYQYTAIRGIESLPQYHATGTGSSILSNRVSYFFDWRGPSVTLDTACSSSLVALHQAVCALRNGEAGMAVAAGSNLILGPEPFISESKLNMLSPNGRSFMWDSQADGYTRGEGFGVVLLKTLSQAIADGDHIECVIRETGVNSDGKTPGITMPSYESQARLIRDTYARCGLDPSRESDRPQYFEAHGTGTPAGDPIEARAIQSVFFPDGGDTDTDKSEHRELVVGSIKTIIGHTEGTAGVAGILKASLALQHGRIPANLHFQKLNPKIQPYYTNLRIPTETVSWPSVPPGGVRRVSVNSFGFGGTNAHAILESYEDGSAGAGADGSDSGFDTASTSSLADEAGDGDVEGDGKHGLKVREAREAAIGPFVLSANSSAALAANASALASHLRAHPDNIDLTALAHTLFRRTPFAFRTAFSACSTAAQLASKLDEAAKSLERRAGVPSVFPEALPPRILGIFTGQGAQWATMGRELYHGASASGPFRAAMDDMQRSLDALPAVEDRPTWRLADQLLAGSETSRVAEAAVSQPLCTALQIALVDTLRAAGIEFTAAVGHSSGEIAAAYTAGHLDAADAIRVAYYRGLHARRAKGPGPGTGPESRGKMMAVGLGWEQATAFCAEFGGGALVVAASNSHTSCTLAGDADAVDKALARLQRDGMFARVLQVDTAYHSHHMQPCAGPYLESLKECGVKLRRGQQQQQQQQQCQWYSSVWDNDDHQADGRLFEGQYWVDNLTRPVKFSQALARALDRDHVFDLALEVGPHAALKGPALETVKTSTGGLVSLPYASVLKRGQDAVESFTEALGTIWSLFPAPPAGRPIITFDGVRRALGRDTAANAGMEHLRVLKGLPPYSWNHASPIWKESRTSRLYRVGSRRGHGRHELLGHPVMYGGRGGARSSKGEVHWKQVLRLQELPWLAGHVIQGEVLFPASGYLSMAYEAALQLVVDDDDKKQKPAVRLVELHDVDIVRAMRLEQDSGLEVVLTVRVTSQSDDCITAQVACYSGPVDAPLPLDAPQTALSAHFTGGVRLWLEKSGSGSGVESDGEENKVPVLPSRAGESARRLPMDALDMDQLYSSFAEAGLQYASPFKAKAMLRRLHRATVTLSSPPEASALHACMHPAPVDTAAQGLLAAFSFPGDGRLSTLYLPTRVDCVRIVPPNSQLSASSNEKHLSVQQQLTADAVVTSTAGSTIVGDIDLFNAADEAKVQIRGICLTAVGQQQRAAWLYAGTRWVRDADSGIEPERAATLSDELNVQYEVLSRASYFYLRQFRTILPQEMLIMSKSYKRNVAWALEVLLPQIEAGKHSGLPGFRSEWEADTPEMIEALRLESIGRQRSDEERYHCEMHWDFLRSVGDKLISVVRSMTPWVRIWTPHQLEWVYADGIGYSAANRDAATLVAQLAHRYPRISIVDVGAGTGGTSGAVLKALQEQQLQHHVSYNYTDISPDVLDRARVLHGHHKNVAFRKLDIDKDPAAQGFPDASVDVVIASKILHKLKSLPDALRRCRQMLRPGGQLILLEPTDDFLMSQIVKLALPDFFVGLDDGRVNGPTVDLERWDQLLRAAGFAGADSTSTRTVSYCSVIVAHAVDDTVQLLREPLAAAPEMLASSLLGDVFIVGGGGAITSSLASQCQNLLQATAPSNTVTIVPGLDAVSTAAYNITPGSAVLCLAELDHPVFQSSDQGDIAQRFRGLQDMMAAAESVLWVTTGARSGRDPFANMVVGMGSTLRAERGPQLRLQFLDVDEPATLLESPGSESNKGPALLATMLLRLAIFDPASRDDLLWTQEPELALSEAGALYIPRVLALDAPNRRNAARRHRVTQQVVLPTPSSGAAVVLKRGREASSWELKTAGPPRASSIAREDVVRVQVTASSLQHFTCSDGGSASAARVLHVCIGRDVVSGEKVVALSKANGSLVSIVQEHHILRRWPLSDKADEDKSNNDPAWLQAFLVRACASRLLLGVHSPTWIHDAPAQLGEALDVVAREMGIAIFQTTSAASAAGVTTFVHPYARVDDLLNLPLPEGLRTFVNLSTSQSGAAIKAMCSTRSIEIKQIDWTGPTAGFEVHGLGHLAKTHDVVIDNGGTGEGIVTLEKASAGLLPVEQQLSPITVVDWCASETVTADVSPLEHGGLFAPSKTYLLCGMTGDMGISVCLWMVERGARHVVLMSRNPNISSSILDNMATTFGANVRPMAVDITNLASLRAAVTTIKADDMPPIGGVMNGAMILRDRLFQNMPWDDFAAVLAPKVTGARNLDAVLCEDEGKEPLDFFICLSSITSIAGNVGQSAYAAANQYMTGLVRQRRRRGHAASVLHIAILTGFGYIHRSDAAHAETMNRSLRTRYHNQAEPDLHAMLAEAVINGRVLVSDGDSDGTTGGELITGLRTVFEGEKQLAQDPRLARYVQDNEGDDEEAGAERGAAVTMSVQAQLAEVGADDEAGQQKAVLEQAFAIALGKLLEMDSTMIDPARPVASLGVDSLVAIRIREWMLREMGVDVSVIKVMSDTYPMSRMCDDVLVSWRKQQKKDKEVSVR